MGLTRHYELVCLLLLTIWVSGSHQFNRNQLFKKRFFKRMALSPSKTRFEPQEKEQILKIHNAYRSVVEPPAANMRELIWDDDLEDYAHKHALACTGAHGARTMVKKWRLDDPSTWQDWYNLGENLYYSYAPMYSVEEALWMFWMEGEKYDIETNTCTHKQTCGHYKALTYAESNRVGCAINTCQEFSISKYPTPAVFLVCEYNGNFLDYQPYAVGERCSHCTRENLGYDAQFCRNGLCVTPALWYRKVGYDGDTSDIEISRKIIENLDSKGGEGQGWGRGRGHNRWKGR